MLATVPSATLLGAEGRPVSVEVHVSNGLPGFTVVGLPDAVCRESRDRVRAALLSSHLPWPLRRVTVNLAPSGVRKGGAGLDLPIAVGLLAATGELPVEAVELTSYVGELGLDGSVRPVAGLLALVDSLRTKRVVVPASGAAEAALVDRHDVRGVASLRQLVDAVRGAVPWPEKAVAIGAVTQSQPEPDLADVRGQQLGRRALEVAAAGGHHLLLVGPPGSGKTMLARRLPGLLPLLGPSESLEVARVWSAAGAQVPPNGPGLRAPFRSPHHGASQVSMVGGGTSWMRPGEVSLAHRGVLFLDELGEFPASVLDSLRQPIEEGTITISRARASVCFPARFLLVAAMNPCPCGEGSAPGSCRCSDAARARYSRRLSGPLLDRMDLRICVERPRVSDLLGGPAGETSAAVSARVARARERARLRGIECNAELRASCMERSAPLSDGAAGLLERRLRKGALSARGLDRVRRVALTLSDLAGASLPLAAEHVAGALELREGAGPLTKGSP